MEIKGTRILPSDRIRHSIRLRGFDYASAGWYFVTICSQNRNCVFGEVQNGTIVPSENGQSVQDCWTAIPSHFPLADIDSWVLMPNHLHGILAIRRDAAPNKDLHGASDRWRKVSPGSLSAIIRSFKSASTREVNKFRGTPGAPLWQRNYFEHVIRDGKDLDRIRVYIQENPARWELDQENPANLLAPSNS